MWPLVSVYAQETIKKTVEPMVVESLREYKINSFAFDKLRLGSIVSVTDNGDILWPKFGI